MLDEAQHLTGGTRARVGRAVYYCWTCPLNPLITHIGIPDLALGLAVISVAAAAADELAGNCLDE